MDDIINDIVKVVMFTVRHDLNRLPGGQYHQELAAGIKYVLLKYGLDDEKSVQPPSASVMGKKGGSAKTAAKVAAARENGRKGGRPKQKKTAIDPHKQKAIHGINLEIKQEMERINMTDYDSDYKCKECGQLLDKGVCINKDCDYQPAVLTVDSEFTIGFAKSSGVEVADAVEIIPGFVTGLHGYDVGNYEEGVTWGMAYKNKELNDAEEEEKPCVKKTPKKRALVPISASIDSFSAEWYPSVFKTLHHGASFALGAFQCLYETELYEMPGKFTTDELMAFVHIVVEYNSVEKYLDWGWFADMIPPIVMKLVKGNRNIIRNYGADQKAIVAKLSKLTPLTVICLTIWALGFEKVIGSEDLLGRPIVNSKMRVYCEKLLFIA